MWPRQEKRSVLCRSIPKLLDEKRTGLCYLSETCLHFRVLRNLGGKKVLSDGRVTCFTYQRCNMNMQTFTYKRKSYKRLYRKSSCSLLNSSGNFSIGQLCRSCACVFLIGLFRSTTLYIIFIVFFYTLRSVRQKVLNSMLWTSCFFQSQFQVLYRQKNYSQQLRS